MMLIEVFSDVVCPWCAIGKRRLESALAGFDHADEVEVRWRAYELDPRAPVRRDGDYATRLAAKYGMSRAQAVAANARLTALGAAEGLDFHFERVRPGNTFDAHRLLHFALEGGSGLQGALKEALLRAYFTDGAPIGERETLVSVATAVGLDRQGCEEVLGGDRYGEAVRADEHEALELGITGVPFFLVDRRFAVPGAQDADTIRRVLDRAWEKGHGGTVGPTAAAGDGDSCPR